MKSHFTNWKANLFSTEMCSASKARWLHPPGSTQNLCFSSASSCFKYAVISILCMLTTKHLTTETQTFTFLNVLDLEPLVDTALHVVRIYKTWTPLTSGSTLFSTDNSFRLMSPSSGDSSLLMHGSHVMDTSAPKNHATEIREERKEETWEGRRGGSLFLLLNFCFLNIHLCIQQIFTVQLLNASD